ncbi:MAG TPA: STAS domain-containing protein [Vulgatibacteraceae bacterium]|nr:STAS domain-containing protein [Vulgatibacteraceae bacterium]
MTVWRTTDGEGGPESGQRAAAPRYDLAECDTALLRVAASSSSPWLLMAGEIDVSNAGEVARALARARDRMPGDLHVDLTAVGFVDVAGMRAFSRAARELDAGGRMLVLHSVPFHIDRVFRLIGWSASPGLQIHCRSRA